MKLGSKNIQSLCYGSKGIVKAMFGSKLIWEKTTNSNLITFTVDGVEYQAEEGMTWVDWCNSKYNTSSDIRVVYTGITYIVKHGSFNDLSEDNRTVLEAHQVIKNNFAYIIIFNDY